MKYCTYCGTQIDDGVQFCPNCGAKQTPSSSETENNFFAENAFGGNQQGAPRTFFANDPLVTERSRGITVLSFIFPIVGLILWLVWKDNKPGKSISASKGALAGLSFNMPILGLIFWLVWKDTNSEMAKPCGIAAIVGFIFGIVSGFVTGVLAVLGFMSNPDLYPPMISAIVGIL